MTDWSITKICRCPHRDRESLRAGESHSRRPLLPNQLAGFVCFAGVDVGPDLVQSEQKTLNRIDAIDLSPSRAIGPADFILALPVIAEIDGEIQLDRNLGLVTDSIDLERSIQDDHSCAPQGSP